LTDGKDSVNTEEALNPSLELGKSFLSRYQGQMCPALGVSKRTGPTPVVKMQTESSAEIVNRA
jgi:hypothetical protein